MSSLGMLDENLGSNVISLENFEDLSDNNLLRAPKKGKVIKGPNWTAFKRENLGAIPRKTENVLIEDKNSKVPLGFCSQSERFSGRSETVKYSYPGPGSYKVKPEIEPSRPSTSYSSKGYCNGFVSESERFEDSNLYYSKYYPGPGQYKFDEKISINSDLNNTKNIKFKSLYDKTEVRSLKLKQEFPGPGFYNPTLLTEMTGPLSAFTSSVTRFKREQKSAFPGPGKYFKEKDNSINKTDGIKKGNTLSYFFQPGSPKKEDPLLKYIEVDKKDEPNFKLKQNYNEGKVYINQVFSDSAGETKTTFYNTAASTKFGKFNFKLDVQKLKNPFLDKKGLISAVNSKYRRTSKGNATLKMRNHSAQPLINMNRTDYLQKKNEKEEKIIKDVMSRGVTKKPLFELSPPRWTKPFYNPIPGPAYYNPKTSPKKSDFFNKDEVRWI